MQQPSDPRRHRERLLSLVGPHRPIIAVLLALALAGAGLGVLEPLLLKVFFDALAAGAWRGPALATGALLGLALAKELLSAASNWLTWRTRLAIHHRLLEITVGRLQTLPVSFHQKESVGAVMTKLDRGIQGLLAAMSDLAFNAMPALIYLALSLAIMAQLDTRLTILVAAFTPIPALIAFLATPEQIRRERALLDRWVGIYSRFNEVLSGIVVVKSFAMEDTEKRRFLDGVSEANTLVSRGVRLDSTYAAARNLVFALARIAAVAAGGYLIIRGEVTVGTVIAFLGYLSGLFGPVQGLTTVYQTVQKARVSLDSLSELLDADDFLLDAPDAVAPDRLEGHIAMDGVYFGYGEGSLVLRGVSLEARRGEVTALVGPSGGGKSTLMALLQRLYDPTRGRITIDGVDLRRLQQRWLRRHIGVVPQEPVLFNDDIRNNIAYGRPDATFEEIVAAAKAANAHEFIERLDAGYQTPVGERGRLLSAGQRQRISIARVLLKDPSILILDEATSTLDAECEALVQEALGRLVAGRTTFVIAHRLTTVVGADTIHVLDHGEIVESGTHGELCARGGVYANLVRRQLAGMLSAA